MKLHVVGIPKRWTKKKVEALLLEHKIPNDGWIRKIPMKNYFDLRYPSMEALENAQKLLDGMEVTEHIKLKASLSNKRKLDANDLEELSRKQSKVELRDIREVVTPLYASPYEAQLEGKQKELERKFRNVSKTILKNSSEIPAWLKKRENKKDPCVALSTIHASPLLVGYRNRIDCTYGLDADMNVALGFAVGKVSAGHTCIARPYQVAFMSPLLHLSREYLEAIAISTSLPPYSKLEQVGVWRTADLRVNALHEITMIITVSEAGETAERIEAAKQCLRAPQAFQKWVEEAYPNGTYQDEPIPTFSIGNILWRVWEGKGNRAEDGCAVELLVGEHSHWRERIMGKVFQVSYESFFQTNPSATEILYQKVVDLVEDEENTILVDLCCGVGTIGITVASKVKEVIGIEMVEQAVEDAKRNAAENGVKNISFYAQKAEDILPKLVEEDRFGDHKVVFIVDPARAGLHKKVLHAIRSCARCEELVYVSCNPASFVNDAVMLCKAPSKSTAGRPFYPTHAEAIDMFPHTEHCELVVLFKRDHETSPTRVRRAESN